MKSFVVQRFRVYALEILACRAFPRMYNIFCKTEVFLNLIHTQCKTSITDLKEII